MDKIIGVSDDEFVVKILSYLPTKVAVSTSILSKHWRFIWMLVTKLDYDDRGLPYKSPQRERMHRFIAKNMPLHRAPVIESFCLYLKAPPFRPEDIKLWVDIAVSRSPRELSITFKHRYYALLSSSLYTCKSLVTLKLEDGILVDVPRVVCLPSLKTLYLRCVKYADEESLQRLLSNCPVLEDLVVKRCDRVNARTLAVTIPSLLSLSITIYSQCTCNGFVIDTPSLKYFKAWDYSKTSSFSFVTMPKLARADLSLYELSDYIKRFLKPVTFVKRLSLSVMSECSEAVYDDDIVFHKLEHLEFHIEYMANWSKVLLWLLKTSPKLRDLKFNVCHSSITSVCWKQLNDVPQCLLLSLQTFECVCEHYPPAEVRDLATYILRNSCRLESATFSIAPSLHPQIKLEVKNELVLSSRGSTTCNLVFKNFD